MRKFYILSLTFFFNVRPIVLAALALLLASCSDPGQLQKNLVGVWEERREKASRCIEYREDLTASLRTLTQLSKDRSQDFDPASALLLVHEGVWKTGAGNRLFDAYRKAEFAQNRFERDGPVSGTIPRGEYIVDLSGDVLKITYTQKSARGKVWYTLNRVEACPKEYDKDYAVNSVDSNAVAK